MSTRIFEEAITRLLAIGWLESTSPFVVGVSHEDAVKAHYSALSLRETDYGREGNGREGKGMEDTEGTEVKSAHEAALSVDDFFEERFSRNPNKNERKEGRELMGDLVSGVDTHRGQQSFRLAHEAWIENGCPLKFDNHEDEDDEDIVYMAGSLADVIHRCLWHSFVTPEDSAPVPKRRA